MNWNHEQAFKRLVAQPIIICVKLHGQHKHHILSMCFTIHWKVIVSLFFNGIKRITLDANNRNIYWHMLSLFVLSTLWFVIFLSTKDPSDETGPKRKRDKATRNDLFVNLFSLLNWTNNLSFVCETILLVTKQRRALRWFPIVNRIAIRIRALSDDNWQLLM